MMPTRKSPVLLVSVFFSVCSIVISLSIPSKPVAQDITLVPSISLQGEFDDNVTFTRGDEIDDYLGIVSPGFTLDYASELLEFAASAVVDVLRYADEKDLDTENQRYNLSGGYRFAERWRGRGNFAYIKDTTLDSELEETGIVNFRQDRERWVAGAGLDYQLTELSDVGASYNYERTDYEEETLEDYDSNSIGFFYSRRFNQGLDTISVRPSFNYLESDENDIDSYRLIVDWTHLPAETYRLSVALGARYTITDFKDDSDATKNWGGLADISLRKSGENYSAQIGFNSDVYYSPSSRDLIQVFRLYGDYSRRILERLSVGFYGRISLSEPDDEDSARDDNIWYFTVSPFLDYRLTENHTLRLAYSYQQEYDKNIDGDERVDRNRVWIALNFNFPYKW